MPYVEPCCAKCTHWDIGTLDYTRRMKAIENGMICMCNHLKGKVTSYGLGETVAYSHCIAYDEAFLTNKPMGEYP